MSELDADALLNVLRAGRCPDCDGKQFRPGPRGGASVNIECTTCRARFNVAYLKGEGVFAERILSEADGGSHWPVIPFAKSDRVRITWANGASGLATVIMASDNGISLVIALDAEPDIGIPVIFTGTGYESLISGNAVKIEPENVQ